MARVNQKNIKEKLSDWQTIRGELDTLEAQRRAAIAPIQSIADKKIEKAQAEFAAPVADASARLKTVEAEITAELKKGYDEIANEFSVKLIEFESAAVEVNTTERRVIDVKEWLEAVPNAQRDGKFFETLNVLIGKAQNFRSDLVAKLAKGNRTHSISFRLK